MKEKIFVDIDEVCSRTLEDGVFPYVNALYGTNLHHDGVLSYRDVFADAIRENGSGIQIERKIEIFKDALLSDEGKNIIQPVAGAVESIIKFSNSFDIGALTARHPETHSYTKNWIENHFLGHIQEVFFSNCYYGGTKSKSEICREQGVKIMIEDDMDYALNLAENGILVFLLKKPWNIHRKEKHANIKRVDSWMDIQL